MVAISITILRYMDNSNSTGRIQNNGYQQIPEDRRWRDNSNGSISRNNLSNGFNGLSGYSHSESSLLTSKGERITFICIVKQLFNCRRLEIPTKLSTRIVGVLTTLFCMYKMKNKRLRYRIVSNVDYFFRFTIYGYWFDIHASV